MQNLLSIRVFINLFYQLFILYAQYYHIIYVIIFYALILHRFTLPYYLFLNMNYQTLPNNHNLEHNNQYY